MRARILGSAAAGGFPQWNCACPHCVAVRRGDRRYRRRTQESIAVFARDDAAVICNASPDIAHQLEATLGLRPRAARDAPIQAIVLTSGDVEHVVGLFSLRESQPIAVYATAAVRRAALARFEGQVSWRELALDRDVVIAGATGAPTDVIARPFALSGPEGADDNIGLRLRCAITGKVIVYAPRAAQASPALADGADVLVFDGTFWSDDELVRLGVGQARARDLAHLPIGGPEGSLARFGATRIARKIYTHVNDTNPVLALGSEERLEAERAGWQIAEDGMEIQP